MKTLLIVSLLSVSAQAPQQWWFLEEDASERVRVQGPFPTEELCRLAGEYRHPKSRKFWTAEKIEAAEQEAREKAAARERHRQEQIAIFLKAKPTGGRLRIEHDRCDIEEITLKADGTQTTDSTWSSSCFDVRFTDINVPYYGEPISGCISQPKP